MAQLAGVCHFAQPPEAVFDIVADERNRYDPTIQRADLLTQGPIGVGTRFRSVAGRGRRATEMIVEITGYDRPRRLDTITHSNAVDITSSLMFESVEDGTLMRWSVQLHPRGPLRLLSPFLAPVGRRQLRRVWTGLQAYLDRQVPAARHEA